VALKLSRLRAQSDFTSKSGKLANARIEELQMQTSAAAEPEQRK